MAGSDRWDDGYVSDIAQPGGPDAWPPQPGDDFFCNRFNVWYRTHDCAVRTKFSTYSGCSGCDQGRFNLKRHAAALQDFRFPFLVGE